MKRLIIEHRGTLCFWGHWFGRPYDNVHQVSQAVLDDNESRLELTFCQGEKCIIEAPVNIQASADTFSVEQASLIVFSWYSYGLPRSLENLSYWRFDRQADGRVVFAEQNHLHQTISQTIIVPSGRAFEIA